MEARMPGGNLSCNAPQGCGTVFKLNLSTLQFTTVHSFSGTDGSNLEQPLLFDVQGNLYSTTDNGGATGSGVIFKIDASGNFSVVYNNSLQNYWNGVQAVDIGGNLYGTTRWGGENGQGSVFRLNPSDSNLETIYSFTGGTDGSDPRSLKLDAQENIWGNTSSGSLFELVTNGDGQYRFQSVQSFAGAGPGNWPGDISIDAQGNQYSTTSQGGDLACNPPNGCGTVYRIDTSNNKTKLHIFTGTNGDGMNPGGMLRDLQG